MAAAAAKLPKTVSRDTASPFETAVAVVDVKRLSLAPTKWYNVEMIELPKPRVSKPLFDSKIIADASACATRTGGCNLLVTGATTAQQNKISEDFAKKGKCWIVEFDPTKPFTVIAHKSTIKEAQDADVSTIVFVIKDCEKLLTAADEYDSTALYPAGSGENSWKKLLDDFASGYDAIDIYTILSTTKSYAELRVKHSFIGDEKRIQMFISLDKSAD